MTRSGRRRSGLPPPGNLGDRLARRGQAEWRRMVTVHGAGTQRIAQRLRRVGETHARWIGFGQVDDGLTRGATLAFAARERVLRAIPCNRAENTAAAYIRSNGCVGVAGAGVFVAGGRLRRRRAPSRCRSASLFMKRCGTTPWPATTTARSPPAAASRAKRARASPPARERPAPVLVTGRQMSDLLAVCPEVGLFDLRRRRERRGRLRTRRAAAGERWPRLRRRRSSRRCAGAASQPLALGQVVVATLRPQI